MQPEPDALTKEEQVRLDALLAAARRFHYSAFVLSGISLALSSLQAFDSLTLPFGDVVVPKLQATVAIYILVLVLILAASRLFNMAYPWMKKDMRRPPFPWVALSSGETTRRSMASWLVLPGIICGIATASSLEVKDITGITLSFLALLFVFLPSSIERDWYLISNRLDHRGGRATFSIWLLHCYRFAFGLAFTGLYFAPVIAVVPKWRGPIIQVFFLLFLTALAMYMVRQLAGIRFVYRRIDGLGRRFGFPVTSKHYK